MPTSRSSFTPGDAALLVVLALMWGNSFLFIKVAVATVPPTWIVAGRLAIGGSLLVVIALLRGRRLPRGRRDVATLATIGLLGAALPWAGQAWAQQFLDSGLMAVLNATTPGATLAIAVAVGQERLFGLRVAGLVVAAIGSVVIVGGEIRTGGPAVALAVGAIAPFAYGIGTVLTRARVSGRLQPLPAAAVQLSTAAVIMTVLSTALAGRPPTPTSLAPPAAAALLALGVFGTGLAFLAYFTLIERVGATNASMVTYLVPVVGLVAGAVVLGERFGPNVLIGAVVLIAGVWLAQRRPPGADADRPIDARTIPRA